VRRGPLYKYMGLLHPFVTERDTEGLKAEIEIVFEKSEDFMKCSSCQICNKYFCNSSSDLK